MEDVRLLFSDFKMKADYTQSTSVMKHLGYNDNEISTIVTSIKQGYFSYMPIKYKTGRINKDKVNGVDIPTMWMSDECATSKTILLLAQDPLRNLKYMEIGGAQQIQKEDIQNYTVIGTPYALHVTDPYIKSKLKLKVAIYRELIDALIIHLDCRVYCTDIFKYYPNTRIINNFDKNILSEEIKLIKPNLCVCLGKFAQMAINEIDFQIKHINAPHPRAWPKSWKKWRAENDITESSDYSSSAKVSNIIALVKRTFQ